MGSLRRALLGKRQPRPARRRNVVSPGLEGLESRIVLYSASGNLWPNPQLITISFMPDGTNLGGGVTSNLISSFNSKASLAGVGEHRPSGGADLGPTDQHQLRRRPRRRSARGVGCRRAGEPRIR
jgi:hypothetical protein